MAALTHDKRTDFHWTPSEIFLSFLVGVAAIAAIWLFTGLMIGLLFI